MRYMGNNRESVPMNKVGKKRGGKWKQEGKIKDLAVLAETIVPLRNCSIQYQIITYGVSRESKKAKNL